MKIVVLPIGELRVDILQPLCRALSKSVGLECVQGEKKELPWEAKVGNRYNASIILHSLPAPENEGKVLGVCDLDLFVPGFAFIFGEAQFMGQRALISLYRLYPQFWGESEDNDVLLERAIKEATHEIGHTLGLRHCPNRLCVMHFSNSIWDTDIKGTLFCPRCLSFLRDSGFSSL